MNVVNKSLVDLRREASTRAERVSQALYGTPIKVISTQEEWHLIETPDGYRGYVEDKHLSKASEEVRPEWKINESFVPVYTRERGARLMCFTFDTRFIAEEVEERLILSLHTGEEVYLPRESATEAATVFDLAALDQLARGFVGTPYLWGGVSSFGFDCSGFVQRLFHYCFNQWLPRDTVDQEKVGDCILLGEVSLGDLCFFPGHVALSLGDGWIVHANRHHNAVSVDQLLNPREHYGRRLLRDLQIVKRGFFVPNPGNRG
jgi:cell wall-associated NlpC family hydrolase